MREKFRLDSEGRPAGGTTEGLGLKIEWQDGPGEKNGADIAEVLHAALGRLVWLDSYFPCPENAQVIEKLIAAIRLDEQRTADRIARGVEGAHAL